MVEADVPAGWVERYLSFLGLPREQPSPDALARLVRAQITRVVFENATAILRRARVADGPVPPVDPDELLEAQIAGRGGGVCFDLAPTFRRLLVGLGYRVQPILAQISFPGSHHATLVDLDGARYLVDVGSGAPLWRPVRLGETIEIGHVGLAFRLRPDGPDAYLRERYENGAWQVACRYDLSPADAAVQEAAYQRHQKAGETWVVGNLTMVRCTEDALHRLRDDELATHTAAGTRTVRLTDPASYRRAAEEIFGLPHLPVEEAMAALEEVRRVRKAAP